MSSSIKINKAFVRFKIYEDKELSLKDFFSKILLKTSIQQDRYFDALNDISLEINPGDRLGIIGRNGAGKSTLLKLVGGIYPPSKGEVIVKGSIASLLELGAGFHPEFTGRENLYLNGAIIGFTERQIKKIETDVITFAELDTFIDMPVKYYSSGMYMRLAFSLATTIHPDILILDEVFAAGDIGFVEKARLRMHEMVDKANILLIVSHDMKLISELANRVIWIESGRVHKSGEPKSVIDAFTKFMSNGNL